MDTRLTKKAVWNGVVLGEGLPKVCVSVMGSSIDEIRASAARAVEARAQILELRIDSFNPMPQADEAIAACRAVRETAGDRPLLFTMRTQRDGGAGSADAAAYEALVRCTAEAKACDAIDVELSVGEAAFARIVRTAHNVGVGVVGSSHEFGEIVDVRRAGEWLLRQEALGADICKAAVMPKSRAQAFELMAEMARAGEQLRVPYAAIVMGADGVASRVCAQALGSCLTFGAAGKASAPGQIEAGRLREMLAVLGGEAP